MWRVNAVTSANRAITDSMTTLWDARHAHAMLWGRFQVEVHVIQTQETATVNVWLPEGIVTSVCLSTGVSVMTWMAADHVTVIIVAQSTTIALLKRVSVSVVSTCLAGAATK